MKTIKLTEDQVKELATLVTMLNGELQYRAVQTSTDKRLDLAWKFWNGISKAISKAIGFESYMVPTENVRFLLCREKLGRMERALEQLAQCNLTVDNCACFEVANRRIRNIARQGLGE